MSQDFGISSLIKTFKGTGLFVCGVIKTLAEDSTLNINNILNAIRDEAHHLLKVKASAGKEVYDITPDIADALKDYIDFKHSGVSDIDAFLAQQDMFANRPSLTASIMREFFAKKASQQQIADTLREYAKLAMLQDNDTPALFETEVAPRERLWELAVNKATGERFSIEAGVSSIPSAEEVAEARRQYDEVVARYTNPDGTKKPGWMKAPNGKPTNLTEEQWVWVRTPNFKKWFGDWEGANLLKLAQKAYGDKTFLSKVEFLPSENLRKALEDELGLDVDSIVIAADSVRHIQKQHGDPVKENNRGQIEMTPEDIAVLPYILNNFDAAKRMTDFDDKLGNKSIDFYKRINGVSVVATISKGKHKQFVVTGWRVKSVAAMPQDVALRLNALNDTDITNVQNHIAEVKRSAKNSSKVVDENGEPLVVYHGTDAKFNVFDRTKTRANMDVQGMFFSPWDIDAQGYGSNVRAFFLNIKNPADSGIGYSSLSKYKGQNNAGVKAREELVARGFDGVNNDNEEYIAFEPSQIKSATDNIGTFDPENPDIRYSVVTDSEKIAELEASPKITGYRTVVLEPDGTLGSPMASGLRSKGKKKQTTSGFMIGAWEQSEERPELADSKGKIDLVKPSGKEVRSVDYNPYIHSRLDCVNSQFKDAWQRPDLVYIENEIPQTDLDSDYHAEKAAKPVGIHKWNGGDLILSRYDKPIRIVPWEEVADDWVKKFKDRGVEFDIVSPQLLPILEERGVEILPPHKNMGDACNAAYREWIENKRVIVLESNDVHARFSITAAEDRAYLDAVRRGDMETAQRMVREAAARAGYTIKSYHGTLATGFTEFKKSFIGSRFSFDDKGFFFIDRKNIAEDYARSEFDSNRKGRVLDVYLKVKKPLIVNAQYALKEGLGKIFRDNDVIDVWDNYNAFLLEEAETKRVDGIIIDDGATKMTVVFDSEQIKSADPVTYDDAGNVIPLSERFNPEKDDIRWSISGIYTGTAADYEKPSLHYVGTGEGSQVYGWGLYGSNVRGVAEKYAMPSGLEIRRRGYIVKPWDDKIANLIRANFTSRNPIESALKKAKEYKAKGYGWEQKDIESLENGDYEVGAPHSNLYEQTFFTNRAPGDESHLLMWYGNVSDPRNNFAEQKKWIRTQAKKEGVKLPRDLGGWGEDIYNTLANVLGSPQAASEFLARAGIDGVKYPVDSYGKTVKDGDEVGWNYVSFRDDNIRVDHKWVDGVQRFSVMADRRIDDALKGVTMDSLSAAIEDIIINKRVDIRGLEGEKLAIKIAAVEFFRKYSRMKLPLSTGAVMFFVPDSRTVARYNGDRNLAWAEYAIHQVTNNKKDGNGKNYRTYNKGKVEIVNPLLDKIVQEDNTKIVDDGDVIFYSQLNDNKYAKVVAKPTEEGNYRADLTDVSSVLENGEMPAQLNPLSAAIDTVETGGVITTVPTPQINSNISQSAPTVNGADVNSRSSIETNIANARLKSQQILDDIKGTVLGDAINKDFKETSTANLIGQTITSPADLAALAQIYRNPSFETFRYFFVKNGEVVWQTGVTARLPSNAPVTVPAIRSKEIIALT